MAHGRHKRRKTRQAPAVLFRGQPPQASPAKSKRGPGQGTGQNRHPAFMAEWLNCPEISDGNRNFSLTGSLFFPKQVQASCGTLFCKEAAGTEAPGTFPSRCPPYRLTLAFISLITFLNCTPNKTPVVVTASISATGSAKNTAMVLSPKNIGNI